MNCKGLKNRDFLTLLVVYVLENHTLRFSMALTVYSYIPRTFDMRFEPPLFRLFFVCQIYALNYKFFLGAPPPDPQTPFLKNLDPPFSFYFISKVRGI